MVLNDGIPTSIRSNSLRKAAQNPAFTRKTESYRFILMNKWPSDKQSPTTSPSANLCIGGKDNHAAKL